MNADLSSQGALVTIHIQNPTHGAVVTDQAQEAGSHRDGEPKTSAFDGSGSKGGGSGGMAKQISRRDRELIAHALINRGTEMLMDLDREVQDSDPDGFVIYDEIVASGALDAMVAALDEEEDRDEDEHEEDIRSDAERRQDEEQDRDRRREEQFAEEREYAQQVRR